MRLLLSVVVLSTIAATAAEADEARFAPAAGSALTYRSITTTKIRDRTITTGQIYTYQVASSDGTVAEGTIKPVALLFDCQGKDSEADCQRAKKAPNAHEENGMTVVPVPAEVADKLAAQSAFKLRAFIFELRKFANPFANPKTAGDNVISADDPQVLTNAMQCDVDALAAFMPIG